MRPTNAAITIAAAGLALGISSAISHAGAALSSHSDAPLIKLDPQANLTDVYAFVGSRDGEDVLNIVANVRPFSEPGDGPHYERFSPDARYSLHVADPASGETLIRYDFQFSPVDEGYQNLGTILSYGLGTAAGPILQIGDAQQNYLQTYTVTRSEGESEQTIAADVSVAPPNAGDRVTPLYNDIRGRARSGARQAVDLDAYTAQAITPGARGELLFAGPRDDSFYADIPGVFDLLNARILDNDGDLSDGLGQDGDGVDGFQGFNVLTFAIQVPIADLPRLDYNDAFFGPQRGVGVYASVSRPEITQRNAGDDITSSGGWVQVNRLGNPLFNEALVPLLDKDRFNATDPTADQQFATYAENPELAALINFVFSTNFQTTERDDLVAIFIPDVLRVATTTGAVPLSGQPGFSRFGFAGGDTTGGVSSGWPNGRRFGDDVIDIALTAIASGPSFETLTVVGDNVAENDIRFNQVFPYAATPHAGSNNRKDPPANDFDRIDFNDDGIASFADVEIFVELFIANHQNF
ncbi:MAG: DUF4331 domain-containing protein [Planctomycetota bacterium]